jgi:EAL domain-containing protein (putative c-di-GMP-specific phosphodiesterase class I)
MSQLHDEFFAAFDQGNWFLASQKIVSLADQSTFGAEILIRLFEGDRFLSNGKFFPGICRDERYPRITQKIVDLISEQLDADANLFEKHVFLNVTPTDFSNALTVEKLAALGKKFHATQRELVLELSEIFTPSELFDCLKTVKAFREDGIIIGLDDYGTGVIRATDIAKFPFDLVKSDRSLCGYEEAWENPLHGELMLVNDDRPLILIAEGIENIDQAKGLAALGYQYVQGYAFDLPSKLIQPNEVV